MEENFKDTALVSELFALIYRQENLLRELTANEGRMADVLCGILSGVYRRLGAVEAASEELSEEMDVDLKNDIVL